MLVSSPRRSTIRFPARSATRFRPLHAEQLEPRALLAGVEVNYPLIDVGGLAYFPGRTDDGDFHLWRSDGTLTGTRMVSPAPMYVQNNELSFLAAVGGTLFFSSPDEFQIPHLWKSNGTASGTTRVTLPENRAQYLDDLIAVGNNVFFDAFDGAHRYLWKSDGTDAGTVPVKDVTVGAGDPYMTNVNTTTLFFMGNDAGGGDELWKSDGTEPGTVRVKDIVPGPGGSGVSQLTNINGNVFFTTNIGNNGQQLWMSNGTEAGTVMLKQLKAISSLAAIGNKLYFDADDGLHGDEPWISDGTPNGTQILMDVRPGPFGSGAGDFENQNGTVLFYAISGNSLGELWKTNGTTAGTELVKAPLAGNTVGRGPLALTSVTGTTFFAVEAYPNGDQLWKTDGTASGTVPVRSFPESFAFQFPEQFVYSGSRLFFARNNDAGYPILWTSDGTTNGTVLLDLSGNIGNHAPEAINDQIDISEDQQVIADPPGVLINDSDADHDPLTAVLSAQPLHGTLSLGPAGNFTYRPDENFNGTDRFVYRASDSQATSGQATVTIHIAAVNDSPTFTGGADQTVRDDAGDQFIPNWTQDASPGPINESDQHLTFHLTADPPSMFAVAPHIESGGHLAFTPAPNAQGDAHITVTLKDDGGTSNGGSDTSAAQTFIITIFKLHPWQNTLNHLDVNGNKAVEPDDVLDIINHLNAGGGGTLPEKTTATKPYYDTDGDGDCTPNDVIEVINDINAHPAQSEAPTAEPTGGMQPLATTSDLISLLAADLAAAQSKRRR